MATILLDNGTINRMRNHVEMVPPEVTGEAGELISERVMKGSEI
jgi:hypothetical protein